MVIELRELSLEDGDDILNMLKEIGPGENGFSNKDYDMSRDEFPQYLSNQLNMTKGIGLKPGYVPQTVYWLMVDGRPVGIGKLRHYLNDALKQLGGHIGYSIRPSERGKGYATFLLGELLVKAREKGLKKVLLTCNEDNNPSRKVIIGNKGVLEKIHQGECHYWIITSC